MPNSVQITKQILDETCKDHMSKEGVWKTCTTNHDCAHCSYNIPLATRIVNALGVNNAS